KGAFIALSNEPLEQLRIGNGLQLGANDLFAKKLDYPSHGHRLASLGGRYQARVLFPGTRGFVTRFPPTIGEKRIVRIEISAKGRGPACAGPRLTTCGCRLRLAAELELAAFGLAEAGLRSSWSSARAILRNTRR